MKHLIPLAALLCGTAHAEFVDGNTLLSQLTDTGPTYLAALGYVAGAADVGYGVAHCPPANVSLKQVADMVKQSLIALPAERAKSADTFVLATLSTTWPCKKAPKRPEVTL